MGCPCTGPGVLSDYAVTSQGSVGLWQYSGTQVHQLGKHQQKMMTQEQTHPEFLVMEELREKLPWRNLADA